MLKERRARQVSGEPRRRWFCDDTIDLIVWLTEDSAVLGFQLCYDPLGEEKAMAWRRDTGYSHFKVDAGEDSPEKNLTPILVKDGDFPKDEVLEYFQEHGVGLDTEIRELVLVRLKDFGHC